MAVTRQAAAEELTAIRGFRTLKRETRTITVAAGESIVIKEGLVKRDVEPACAQHAAAQALGVCSLRRDLPPRIRRVMTAHCDLDLLHTSTG